MCLDLARVKPVPPPWPAHDSQGQYRFISRKGAVVLAGSGKGELLEVY
jgi:hypothetical protein